VKSDLKLLFPSYGFSIVGRTLKEKKDRKLSEPILKMIERKDYPMDRLYDLNAGELGELIHFQVIVLESVGMSVSEQR
jgi:hypothetical protein